MYNLLPGQGMGFTANRLLVFGLAWIQRGLFAEILSLISQITRVLSLESRLR